MIETHGRIVALHDGLADVRLSVASACGACGHRNSCDQHGGNRERTVRVAAPLGAHAGDRVMLSLPESTLHLGSLLGYLLPAVATLGGAIALATGGDAAAVLGAGLGLGAGLLCVRLIGRRWADDATLPMSCTPASNSPHGDTP